MDIQATIAVIRHPAKWGAVLLAVLGKPRSLRRWCGPARSVISVAFLPETVIRAEEPVNSVLCCFADALEALWLIYIQKVVLIFTIIRIDYSSKCGVL